MIWTTQTPLFRAAISLATLWIVIVGIVGTTSGFFLREAEKNHARQEYLECRSELDFERFDIPAQQASCEVNKAAFRMLYNDSQFISGGGLIILAKYLVLPAALVVLLAGFWPGMRGVASRYIK